MINFKGVVIGLATVVLGCIVTPIVGMLWWSGKATIAANQAAPPGSGEVVTVSFSPMGLIHHFGLPRPWFLLFLIALFFAGYSIFAYLQKR